MTKVREMMTTDPLVVDASTPLAQVAKQMRDRDIGDVLIDQDGTTGILTDRDIVIRGIAEDAMERTAGDLATFDLESVSPDDELAKVISEMREDAIRRVPVVEDGTLVGILSLGDLAVIRDEESVLADISAAPADR